MVHALQVTDWQVLDISHSSGYTTELAMDNLLYPVSAWKSTMNKLIILYERLLDLVYNSIQSQQDLCK